MRIKVLVNHIYYRDILEYYNSHKSDDEESLHVLNRMEGGFYIKIPEIYNEHHFNSTTRQVRWSYGILKSFGLNPFTENQTLLLYNSLVHVLGESKVLLISPNPTNPNPKCLTLVVG